MLSQARNYDILQVWKSYSQLDSSQQRELDKVVLAVNQCVSRNVDVPEFITKSLPLVFELRVKAIQWLLENQEMDLPHALEEVYADFKKMEIKPQFSVLIENILFALRCNKRVIDALTLDANVSKDVFSAGIGQLPDLSFAQFKAFVSLTIPDETIKHQILDWTYTSLKIEFVVIACMIINDKNITVTDKTVNDLSFVVADAAQKYTATAMKLGLLKPRSLRHFSSGAALSRDFINEQKRLADSGLDDFESNFK